MSHPTPVLASVGEGRGRRCDIVLITVAEGCGGGKVVEEEKKEQEEKKKEEDVVPPSLLL